MLFRLSTYPIELQGFERAFRLCVSARILALLATEECLKPNAKALTSGG